MARVLWLTTQPPDLDGGGGNIRQAHLLAGVAAEHEVHLAVVGHLDDDRLRARLAAVTELASPPSRPPARGLRRRAEHLRSIVQTEPADCVDQAAARALLAEVVEEADVDVVCVEHLALTPLLPARRTARWVATLHNLPSVQAEQVGAVSAGPAARWYWGREAGKARRRERWAAAAFDLTVVCSDDDAARLPPGTVVVPNGADPDRVPATPVPPAPEIVFVGSLDYRPNIDGAQWLCQEVLPTVRAARPDVVVRLVGHQPAPAVRELADEPGVEVHGDVPSVDPFLLDARVAVVPLRIGSGTRLKALEAMAARRPVVGTSVGLAGLGVTDGVDALVADDAEAFAGAVLDLLDDDALAARLVAGGRRLVEDRYGWTAIARRYADLLAASATPVRG